MTRVVAVMPIGPNCKPEFVADTIASIDYFVPERRLILLDDSGRSTASNTSFGSDVEVIEMTSNGLAGGLFATLGAGFAEALSSPFDVLLRIDTDALVTGKAFADQASAVFRADSRVATLGSFQLSYHGNERSFEAVRRKLVREAFLSVRDRQLGKRLRSLLVPARRNGYRLGESVMGGVTLYSRNSIETLNQAGLLSDPVLSRSTLQEDHLFALCLYSLGFKLQDFGTVNDSYPMGVKHRGLPASPTDLVNAGKSLVHSTKFFEERDEASLREEFRELRNAV